MEGNHEILKDDEIDLAQLAAPLIARWKLLLIVSLLGGIIAFAYSKTLPKTYESSSSIYVQQNSGTASLLRNLPMVVGGGGSSSGYFVTLLQSDTLHRDVISRLNLIHNRHFAANKPMNETEALKALKKMVNINETKSGAISVTVRAKDPELAARIANSMLDGLGMVVVTASRRKADFIEQRLNETTRDLGLAEEEMSAFMEKNQVAAIDEQTKEMILRLGELDAKLLDLDAQLQGINSELANAGNLDDLVEKEVQKRSLQTSRDYVLKERDDLHSQLEKLPAIATRYARIQRKIAVLTSTFQLLTEQYQLARITQKGEDGDYQIVDLAHPNPNKVAPSSFMNAVIGGMLFFAIASLIILLRSQSNKRRAFKRQTVSHTPTHTPVERG